jgi:hypothetical protein
MTPEEAVRAVISGEDAAVYAYGVIGPRLAGGGQRRARRAFDSHRAWRDLWQARMTDAITPPAVAYDLPFPVTDADTARRLAIWVEESMVAVYADLAGAATGDERVDAVTAACECATRAVAWGAATQAFPAPHQAPASPGAADQG